MCFEGLFTGKRRGVRQRVRRQQLHQASPSQHCGRHDGGRYGVRDDVWVQGDDAFVSLARGA